jgi:hypothetical protein
LWPLLDGRRVSTRKAVMLPPIIGLRAAGAMLEPRSFRGSRAVSPAALAGISCRGEQSLPSVPSKMVSHDRISHCIALPFSIDMLARCLQPGPQRSRGRKQRRAALSEGPCPARRRRKPSRRQRCPLSKAIRDVAPTSRHSQACWTGSRIMPSFRISRPPLWHRGCDLTIRRATSTLPPHTHQRSGTRPAPPTQGRQAKRTPAPVSGRTNRMLLHTPLPGASLPIGPPRMCLPTKRARCLLRRTQRTKPRLRRLLRPKVSRQPPPSIRPERKQWRR